MPRKGSNSAIHELRKKVEDFIWKQDKNTFNYKIVSAAVGAKTPAAQRSVALLLAELAFDGDILEVETGKYKAPERTAIATGTFVRRSNGKNSVITDEDSEAIFVAERNSLHALNGDRVKVHVAARRRGQEPEAEVIEIIEKKEQTFIGVLEVERNVAFLKTDSKFLACDIFIPRSKLKGGKTGDKAIVRITEWPEDSKNPRGEVIDILGKNGDNTTEMHAILAEFGLPYKYPKNVEDAADKIGAGITPEEIGRREDFRGVTTFTIDPKDAKDFDDALSIRRLPNGNTEVGVHIADVTHYVTPNSIIDREAKQRATSVYLVDRTIPMLPSTSATASARCGPTRKNWHSHASSNLTTKPKSRLPALPAQSSSRTAVSPTKRLRSASKQARVTFRRRSTPSTSLPRNSAPVVSKTARSTSTARR